MSDTPETDSKTNATFGNHSCATVLADFARKLERERDEAIQRRMETVLQCELLEKERDEARHEIQGWKNKFNCAVDMGARAENESEEQARLLGMSAEREESVRGKLFLAERELAKLKEAAKSVVEVWETPPWKIGETPSNAITQLRDAIGYED
jgi:hypothetical protein